MDVFNRLAPFIQDFIYQNNWEELRGNQVAACEVIFDSDDNLLLSSGTASGKTEAAFLPVLTELYEKPSSSVGVMYISPLKALINDQFKRLEQMLLDSNIPVTKWHGDASQSLKNKLIKNPEGLLQITPESLESLITGKRGACLSLFSDLRYVIIDEVHYFMRDVRGLQLLCVLERIRQLTGVNPRRIGLSATLGDVTLAQKWLNTGTGRTCAAPIINEGKKLSEVREAAGISRSQLVRLLREKGFDVKPYTISKWESGTSNPNVEAFLAICDICRVIDIRQTFAGKRLMKLYDIPVSAGLGNYLDNGDFNMIEVDSAVPDSADYAVRVSGDSMMPRFVDRQIIFIHEQPALDEGEIGIYCLNNDAYLKKLGRKCLVSLNPKYDPIPIREHDELKVLGKVVG